MGFINFYWSMRLLVLFFLLFVFAQKPSEEIIKSFSLDNYNVKQEIKFQDQRGFMAEHKTATVLSTKKHKKVFYVEGNGYQMGYVIY